MKQILLFSSISLASGLLFVNLYTSLVDAKSWGGDLPSSIATARDYFKNVNPGNFFRIFSPLNQVLALVVLVAFWKVSPQVRWSLAAALVLYSAGEAMTFAYFYPRNDVMFQTAALTDTALLKQTWLEWRNMNWVRSLLIAAGLVMAFVSLHRTYSLAASGRHAAANNARTQTATSVPHPAQPAMETRLAGSRARQRCVLAMPAHIIRYNRPAYRRLLSLRAGIVHCRSGTGSGMFEGRFIIRSVGAPTDSEYRSAGTNRAGRGRHRQRAHNRFTPGVGSARPRGDRNEK